MSDLQFTIALTSDAEHMTGMSTKELNGCVSRDHEGRPVVRASHMKGLMRHRLREISNALMPSLADRLEQAVFGRAGTDGDDGAPSRVHLGDACATKDIGALRITRTALDDTGTASVSTLRTNEAVPVDTEFRGHVRVDGAGVIDIAARLSLLAVDAVGGNRRRGAGACRVRIEGDDRTPGEMLRALLEHIPTDGVPAPKTCGRPAAATELDTKAETVWLHLTFEADAPVCCPENPVVGINVIRSGFTIPASAVQE